MRLIIHLLLFAGLALGAVTTAAANPAGDYPRLLASYDSSLQEKLEDRLNKLGLLRAIRRDHLAVALVDITDPLTPRVAELNGNVSFYAASLPKLGILLSAFVLIEQGQMTFDADTKESLTQMIRFSSNAEATRVLNAVGKKRVNSILRSERYRLYDPKANGGLWVGKEYGKAPAFERDPLHHTSHAATALQTARFYYLLETGRLVSPALTAEMKLILSEPAIEHKFVKGLKDRPNVHMFRKSGTWRRWHSDSAVVEAQGHKYILVALADDPNGGRWLERMAGPLHDLIVPRQTSVAFKP